MDVVTPAFGHQPSATSVQGSVLTALRRNFDAGIILHYPRNIHLSRNIHGNPSRQSLHREYHKWRQLLYMALLSAVSITIVTATPEHSSTQASQIFPPVRSSRLLTTPVTSMKTIIAIALVALLAFAAPANGK